MAIEDRLGDAGRLGDFFGGRRLVAVADEELLGTGQQLALALRLAQRGAGVASGVRRRGADIDILVGGPATGGSKYYCTAGEMTIPGQLRFALHATVASGVRGKNATIRNARGVSPRRC